MLAAAGDAVKWSDTLYWPTPAELLRDGYYAAQAKEVGYAVEELKQADCYTAADLSAAGFDGAELLKGGCTVSELRLAGISAADMFATSDKSPWFVKSLREGGYLAAELIGADTIATSAAVMWRLGLSATEAKEAGASSGNVWNIIAQLPGRGSHLSGEALIGEEVIAHTRRNSAKVAHVFGKVTHVQGDRLTVACDDNSNVDIKITDVRLLDWGKMGAWKVGLLDSSDDLNMWCCEAKAFGQLFALTFSANTHARLVVAFGWGAKVFEVLMCGLPLSALLAWIILLLIDDVHNQTWMQSFLDNWAHMTLMEMQNFSMFLFLISVLISLLRVWCLARIRHRIRARHNILPTCSCGGHDDCCLVASFCSPCLVCQLARHEGVSSSADRLCSETDDGISDIVIQTQPNDPGHCGDVELHTQPNDPDHHCGGVVQDQRPAEPLRL